MISKISKPVIGKLSGLSVSGSQTGTMDSARSPRSPLDFKIQSPRSPKGYDIGGVGLAIVAVLDEINTNKAVYNRSSNKSISIPINSPKRSSAQYYDQTEFDNFEEDYTVVTCRGPNNKSYTRVYCNGLSEQECKRSSSTAKRIFDIAPARFGDIQRHPNSDFLSSCHLCNKKLHGKDIYMYRGEKAFCSTECRYNQIVMDEHREKCSSEVSRSADIASSPYANDQIFSTGILAI